MRSNIAVKSCFQNCVVALSCPLQTPHSSQSVSQVSQWMRFLNGIYWEMSYDCDGWKGNLRMGIKRKMKNDEAYYYYYGHA